MDEWDEEPRGPTPEVMAEHATLGAAMLGSRLMPDAADLLAPDAFADPHLGTAWAACQRLSREDRPVNPQSVADALTPKELRAVGGPLALVRMTSPEVAPLPSQLLAHAERVRDLSTRRRLREAAGSILTAIDEREDALQAVEDARQAVDAAAAGVVIADAGATIGQAMAGAIDWMEHQPIGAGTPWADVDAATNGLLEGQMITVAARPGHGKSLVAKDVALRTARQGKAVHVATLEMSRNEYLARILAGVAKVELGRILRRELDDGEWERIARASAEVRDLPLYLDDRESQTMATIRAGARTTQRRLGPLGLIAIDYAQLVTPTDRRLPREQQVADISRQTKLLAKEFCCPVLLLAQLNRGNTQRADHTPLVSDLRESGSLEQDSDQVWLLHRADQYPGGEDRYGEVDLIVGKNRNGPAPTTIRLAFQGHFGRISSLAR